MDLHVFPIPIPRPHLPLHPIPLGLPSAPGPSACLMHPTWAGDLFHPTRGILKSHLILIAKIPDKQIQPICISILRQERAFLQELFAPCSRSYLGSVAGRRLPGRH